MGPVDGAIDPVVVGSDFSRGAVVRVFFLNNYSMRKAVRTHRAGAYPGQHLWGWTERRPSDTWVLPPSVYDVDLRPGGLASRLRRALVRAVGDPLQQLVVALRVRRGDVVYAADQRSALLLGVLAGLGLLPVPYVVIVHHPPRGRLERLSLRGAAQLGVLSDHLARSLPGLLGPRCTAPVTVLPWGPERTSPVYGAARRNEVEVGEVLDFVAAGRTNREYGALREAARRGRLDGVLFDGTGRTTYRAGRPEHRPGASDYPTVAAAMARARCVVVPLRDPDVMAGLTEVADAIALDVPLVVTRSRAFPYDLEGRRAGVFLDDGGPGEIRAAIERARAGRLPAPRPLAATYDITAFGAVLDRLLHPAPTAAGPLAGTARTALRATAELEREAAR